MDLALYHPVHGYYERTLDQVGREGDFHTSVSVGSLFGELLAWRFAEWLQEFPRDTCLHLVEAGAHQGLLAGDILRWWHRHRPELVDRVTYAIVEPSSRRRAHQRAVLAELPGRHRWFSGLAELGDATGGIHGILFSNELLDAFPVHRLTWNATDQAWRELGVGRSEDRLIWLPREQSPSIQPPTDLFGTAPGLHTDGFLLESCPTALQWWQQASGLLHHGHLITFDYGLESVDFLDRPRGTLRGYRNHAHTDDVLTDPGGQDLTAHVNWTLLRDAGEAAGLTTEARETQGTFLTKVLRDQAASDPETARLDPKRIRQFQTLTHPQHFGTRFQVLSQVRLPARV